MAGAQDILKYWFGELDETGLPAAGRERLWFGKDSQVDNDIRARFGTDVEHAARGELEAWRATPPGTLALILLLDQFPRNIYRDTPQAFAHDDLALGLAQEGVRLGQDRELGLLERAFFYLPFEHAEDLVSQQESVRLFSRLAEEAPPAVAERLRVFLDYAVRHRDIIARFGRFPHRNQALGRTSTETEFAFLATPGSSF